MSADNEPQKKENKKQQVIVKLEWIFGIRSDLTPNIYLLDKDTLVYPAGHYIVIFNHPKNLGPNNIQHYIPGTPHSKGIVAIATCNFTQRIVAFAEETSANAIVSFYNITGRQGLKNYPDKQSSFEFNEWKINKIYALEFSTRRKMNNYCVGLGASDTNYYFIFWKWDLEAVRDDPIIHAAHLPEHALKDGKYKLSFSTSSMENDQFSLVSDSFIIFYQITQKGYDESERIDLNAAEPTKDFGSVIYSHAWLFEGNFCFITDKYINILDGKFKQLTQQIENPDNTLRIIAPYTVSSAFEGFVAGGLNKTLNFYGKRNEQVENEGENNEEDGINVLKSQNANQKDEFFELFFSKTKYDFVPGLNEKITADKLPQNDKGTSNDRQFDFKSICTYFEESFLIATTSNNDLIYIDTEEKEIDRKPVRHLLSPFHSDSIEGMDVCINKPYIITCSKDKSIRLWDYQQRAHVICKLFEEELYSITYHPSGMHALVSTDDKIFPLNVFYDEIDNMTQPITTKAKSKDIKFSNLGHLFAFDSGTFVQIWDFLNMQIFSGPPPYGQQKKSFSTTTSKINFLAWNEDDKNLLACGHEYIYDWRVKEDHDTKPKMPGINVTSVTYLDSIKTYIATTEDMKLRKLVDGSSAGYVTDAFDFSMKELTAMRKNKILLCATSKYSNLNSDSPSNNSSNLNGTQTTCLRIFTEIEKSNYYVDVPSHHGETTRVRFSNEENKIFTCGEDGCLNIYSIEFPFDSEPDRYINEQNMNYTTTVLIKKTRFKERDFDKKELPAKRDEKLKKIKSENNDKRENDKKLLEEMRNRIATTKYTENNIVNKMKSDLQNTEVEYNTKIKTEKQANDNEHDTQFNNNQIQLSGKTREVEAIRELIKQHKDEHKAELNRISAEAKRRRQESEEKFANDKGKLEATKADLEGKIKFSEENKVEDGKALQWLNDRVISEIKSNIDELSHKIDELRVHYTHHIKKQKEEKEKLQQMGENLNLELKKIEEEKARQIRNKEKNKDNKKKAEDEMEKMTKRISEIENKIIECKKSHTYLEKCKFVLSYKIQELKKEAGPMEKVLEDLQKRTKEDELSLSKYNREFDIIANKLVDLEDLKEKTKTHEKTERDLKNEINSFKIDLFNMLSYIDDYDKLREGFRNLREKYLKNYVPEVQDHELEGEFSNQKSKMKNRVFELQETLNVIKKKHKSNISKNRDGNNGMIYKIAELKQMIKKEKKTKETLNGDQKHANAVAEIFAGQFVKKLMLEDISLQDKIQLFKDKIKAKKEELKFLRNNVQINPMFLSGNEGYGGGYSEENRFQSEDEDGGNEVQPDAPNEEA